MKLAYLLWSKVMTAGLRALVAFIGGGLDWIVLIGEAEIQFLVRIRRRSRCWSLICCNRILRDRKRGSTESHMYDGVVNF